MPDLDLALEDCLDRLARGESLEDCLARHPEHSAQLRPLLEASARLERSAGAISPSPAFRAAARTRLHAHMRTNPRRKPAFAFGVLAPAWRLAFTLLVFAALFAVSGTVLAQSALPGGPLYGWKLASEQAWRAFSPDPLAADLVLAERRKQELLALHADPAARAVALQGYRLVLVRIEQQSNPLERARAALALLAHQSQLAEIGIAVPELDRLLGGSGQPVPPQETPSGTPPLPTLPVDIPTQDLPLELPTVEIPLTLTPLP